MSCESPPHGPQPTFPSDCSTSSSRPTLSSSSAQLQPATHRPTRSAATTASSLSSGDTSRPARPAGSAALPIPAASPPLHRPLSRVPTPPLSQAAYPGRDTRRSRYWSQVFTAEIGSPTSRCPACANHGDQLRTGARLNFLPGASSTSPTTSIGL